MLGEGTTTPPCSPLLESGEGLGVRAFKQNDPGGNLQGRFVYPETSGEIIYLAAAYFLATASQFTTFQKASRYAGRLF